MEENNDLDLWPNLSPKVKENLDNIEKLIIDLRAENKILKEMVIELKRILEEKTNEH